MSKTTKNRTGSFSRTLTQSGGKIRIPDNSIGLRELKQEILNALVPIGTPVATLGTAAPTGYLMLDNLTIGKQGTAATAVGGASQSMKDIYTFFWNNLADSQAPVSGGRGATATADFNAGKLMTLPDGRGRAFIGRDPTGLRVTGATVLGNTGGSQSVSSSTAQTALTTAMLPQHAHTFTSSSNVFQTNDAGGINNIQPTGLGDARSTAQTGSNAGHAHTYTTNVVQPYMLVNWMVRI